MSESNEKNKNENGDLENSNYNNVTDQQNENEEISGSNESKESERNFSVNNDDILRNLRYTAFDGRVDIDWEIMKSYLEIQFKYVIDHLPKKTNSNSNNSWSNYVDNILNSLNKFTKPPFTIQRICELLLFPTKYYKTADNFLFAINKLVDIENI